MSTCLTDSNLVGDSTCDLSRHSSSSARDEFNVSSPHDHRNNRKEGVEELNSRYRDRNPITEESQPSILCTGGTY